MGTKLTLSLNIFFYYEINIFKSVAKGKWKKLHFEIRKQVIFLVILLR